MSIQASPLVFSVWASGSFFFLKGIELGRACRVLVLMCVYLSETANSKIKKNLSETAVINCCSWWGCQPASQPPSPCSWLAHWIDVAG
jgi:hypothetical protein